MALDSGNWPGDININSPLNTVPRSEGASQILTAACITSSIP